MRIRPVVIAVSCAATVVIAAAVVYTHDRPATQSSGAPPTSTAEVVRTDLVARTDVDGTLGFAASYTIAGAGHGTVTWLPAVGDVLTRGERTYAVDNAPIALFYGSTPLWRPVGPGVTNGWDVAEVERNLKLLGYGGFTVDEVFTDATRAAIETWQDDTGLPVTGTIDPGAVVIEPGALRVSAVTGVLGQPPRGPVLTATGTERQVTVSLPVTQEELAVIGAKVLISLPGGHTTRGTVTEIGTIASAASADSGNGQTGEGTQTATLPVSVSLDQPSAAGSLDGAPVTVAFTSAARQDVLAVPITALLADAEGRYLVRVIVGDQTRDVDVTLGIFAESQVEVSGAGLRPGMKLEVAST